VPDGVYSNEVHSDGYEAPVVLKVTITKRDDEMLVDWAGSSPESAYGINVVLNYTHAYTTYALKCALAPDVPNNEGSFRPVTVTAPEGCILNAQHPAPVCGRHILGHFLPGAIFGALSDVLPDRVLAEGAANIWSTQLSGRQKDGSLWTYVWFSTGGTGARPNKDGISAAAFPSGISGVPGEVIESLAPILIHRREYRADSGGPGQFRGGLGQSMEFSVRTGQPYTFSLLFDRTRHAAAGYAGGKPGALARVELSNDRTLDSKGALELDPATRVTLNLPGGGGFFDPSKRDPQAVLDDVIDGLVSVEQARVRYGVMLDAQTLAIDHQGTCALRERLFGGSD
jgi:N-methylhydantoinase B